MNGFFGFMASTWGRIVRIVAGLILIYLGLWPVGGTWGYVLAVVGLVPLAAGLFDFCVFAPLFGLPIIGPSLRKGTEE